MTAFYRTQSLVFSNALLDAWNAALSAPVVAALLKTPTIHLLKTNVPITYNFDVTSFGVNESTFAGYTAQAVGTLLGPINIPILGRALHAEADWVGGAVVFPGENITGYVVTDSPVTVFYCGEALPTPVPIAAPGDAFSLDFIIGHLCTLFTGVL